MQNSPRGLVDQSDDDDGEGTVEDSYDDDDDDSVRDDDGDESVRDDDGDDSVRDDDDVIQSSQKNVSRNPTQKDQKSICQFIGEKSKTDKRKETTPPLRPGSRTREASALLYSSPASASLSLARSSRSSSASSSSASSSTCNSSCKGPFPSGTLSASSSNVSGKRATTSNKKGKKLDSFSSPPGRSRTFDKAEEEEEEEEEEEDDDDDDDDVILSSQKPCSGRRGRPITASTFKKEIIFESDEEEMEDETIASSQPTFVSKANKSKFARSTRQNKR